MLFDHPDPKDRVTCVSMERLSLGRLPQLLFTVFKKGKCLSGVLYGKGGFFCAGYDLGEVATSVADDGARLKNLLPPYHKGHDQW